MDDDLEIRVARLEMQMAAQSATMIDVHRKVDDIANSLTRYQGLAGGVMLVLTAVSAFFSGIVRSWFMGHWK